jgi:tetratricopeptide (TPR) repeat protein
MRAFVLTDKSLKRLAGRFVWLEMDTEKPVNAALRQRLGILALPTFFVVDPASEKVALRWVGGATLPQLEKLLEDGRSAVAAAGREGAGPTSRGADAELARADRLYGSGDYAGAASAFDAALALAPAGWPHYGRVVESLLIALGETDGDERGARLAREAFPRLRRSASAANVAATGLDMALGLPAEHRSRRELIDTLEADCREVLADESLPVAADDRSAVFGSLLDARKAADDEAGARRVAEAWAAFLDGVAARADGPDGRVVFDSHRLAAYLELGAPERAVPMLEASQRDFPDDYNPPARLAIAYRAMKRWDEALAASDRAVALAYGPRKLTILQVRADIFMGRADTASARRTLEDAVALAESFPAGQRSASTIASLRKKLAALP